MKWLLAVALIAVMPAAALFTRLTKAEYLPVLDSAPEEFNIQYVPLVVLFAVCAAAALFAWHKLKPAKILIVAAAWNVGWCLVFGYSVVYLWGEH